MAKATVKVMIVPVVFVMHAKGALTLMMTLMCLYVVDGRLPLDKS